MNFKELSCRSNPFEERNQAVLIWLLKALGLKLRSVLLDSLVRGQPQKAHQYV